MEELISGLFNAIFSSEILSIKYAIPLALVIGGIYGYADSADGTVRKLSLGLAVAGGIGLLLVMLNVIG
jgi:hypothetical protein